MPDFQELPLFPLHTVLFPGMPLPLHIFEDRYKQLINLSIKQASPFGVVLIREGQEVGGEAIPFAVGTSAFVTQAERLPGGRMNINAVGFQRFRIIELRHDKPYLVGITADFPLETSRQAEVTGLISVMRSRLLTYLAALTRVLDIEYDWKNVPDDAVALAFYAAIVLNLPAIEKQDLLEIPDLENLLGREARLLSRERSLLDFMHSQEDLTKDQIAPFSTN